jgi:hypothetical protein
LTGPVDEDPLELPGTVASGTVVWLETSPEISAGPTGEPRPVAVLAPPDVLAEGGDEVLKPPSGQFDSEKPPNPP